MLLDHGVADLAHATSFFGRRREDARQFLPEVLLVARLEEVSVLSDPDKMRQGEGIGLTTVYRTLQTLADAGEIDVLRTDSGEAVYRRCSTEHHHHLVCRHCGRAVEVSDPPVEDWAERIAREYGFTEVGHTVEITGTCPSCAEQQ